MSLKAIILAGGMGTRLRHVVPDVPKPMAPVGGKPFLEYLINQLKYWGHEDIILSVGHLKEVIADYFQDGSKWGVSMAYSEEDSPLGTGGAVKKALTLFDDKECIVMNGDSFFDLDFEEFVNFHKTRQSDATMALTHMQDVARYGSVVTDEGGKVVSFEEKGDNRAGLINCGIYILHRTLLKQNPSEKISLENDILAKPLGHSLFGFVQQAAFIDIGIPEDFMEAQKKHFLGTFETKRMGMK